MVLNGVAGDCFNRNPAGHMLQLPIVYPVSKTRWRYLNYNSRKHYVDDGEQGGLCHSNMNRQNAEVFDIDYDADDASSSSEYNFND